MKRCGMCEVFGPDACVKWSLWKHFHITQPLCRRFGKKRHGCTYVFGRRMLVALDCALKELKWEETE